jgi:hypothetical protein
MEGDVRVKANQTMSIVMIWPSSFKSSCMEGMKKEHDLLDFAQFPRKPEQTMSMTDDLAMYHRARYACLITYLSTCIVG